MQKRLPGTLFARNLVERRTLILQLVKRDFHQRYIGSAVGWLWGLIHPIVLLAVYTFIFSYCLHQKLGPDQVTTSYPLFLFAGMLPWLLFSETVQRASGSLVEQANLITKTVFPSEIIPVSIYLSSAVSHLLALTLAIVVSAIWQQHLNPFLFLLPVLLLFLGMLAVGIGWIASALHVYLRDTAQIIQVILTFWWWITPIFLTESQFPVWARFVLTGNPLAYFVRAYRMILLGTQSPPAGDLAAIAAWSIITFVCGGLVFRYLKKGFADVL